MKLGIFARTFARAGVDAVFEAVRSEGLSRVQFNVSCCGLPTVPESVPDGVVREIRDAMHRHGIEIVAISATFNLIHPDLRRRAVWIRSLGPLAAMAASLGAPMLTLCTGTRDAGDMWRYHPGNASPDAWRELLAGLRDAIEVVRPHPVCLGIEPEWANVVSDVSCARRLFDDLGSDRLRVVLDPANLLRPETLPCQGTLIAEAVAALGSVIAMAHAKELNDRCEADGRGAGRGVVDWAGFVEVLGEAGFDGPIVLHGLDEKEIPGAVRHLVGLGVEP